MLGTSRNKKIAAISFFGILFAAAIFLFLFSPSPIFAQEGDFGFGYGDESLLGKQDIRVIIFKIIQVILGLTGIVFLCFMIYAGWMWMSSEGEPEKINKAKSILRNAAIGLFIILASLAIVQFILYQLAKATGYGMGPTGPSGEEGYITGGLGNGIIESHYPARYQEDVPRNTMIIVTFKEPMHICSFAAQCNDNGTPENTADDKVQTYFSSSRALTTFTYGDVSSDYDSDGDSDGNGNGMLDVGDGGDIPDGQYVGLNTNAVKIFERDDTSDVLQSQEVLVAWTEDKKTFKFFPLDPLGSPSEDIWHRVSLETSILKEDGDRAFTSGMGTVGYEWDFETSTFLDLTPPQIASVFPVRDSTEPRNVIIKINFNEPVDPTTTSGQVAIEGGGDTGGKLTASSFKKITAQFDEGNDGKYDFDSDGDGVFDVYTFIAGTFKISNQYQTVEFISQDACGKNSCGETIYCLPGEEEVSMKAFAAKLDTSHPHDNGFYAYTNPNGIVDMANNSFDGNKDGISQGTDDDDDVAYPEIAGNDHENWEFTTTNEIDLTAPEILETLPPYDAHGVSLTAALETLFSKVMQSSTLNSDNMKLPIPLTSSWSGNYWIRSSDDYTLKQTRAYWNHDRFPDPNKEAADATDFDPEVHDGVRDVYQNCYNPSVGPVTKTESATVQKINLSDGSIISEKTIYFFKRAFDSNTLYNYDSSSDSASISNHSNLGINDADIAGITPQNGTMNGVSRLFLYKNTAAGGRLSLGIVHDDKNTTVTDGAASWMVKAPVGSYISISDDIDADTGLPEFRQTDSASPATVQFTGEWDWGKNSDGGMLDLPYDSSWEIFITPISWKNVAKWIFLSAENDGTVLETPMYTIANSPDTEYGIKIIYPAK